MFNVVLVIAGVSTIFGFCNGLQECCADDVLLMSRKICNDSALPNLTCKGYTYILIPDYSLYHEYIIKNDSTTGKSYLYAGIAGFKVTEPYFCSGKMKQNNVSMNVAMICDAEKEMDADTAYPPRDTSLEYVIARIAEYSMIVFNILSFILLALTAFIYYKLPEVQDAQGTCTFHYTFNLGLCHGVVSYLIVFNTNGVFPDLCITYLYCAIFAVLATEIWCCLSSYNTWRHSRGIPTMGDEALLSRYRLIGYGVPALLVILAFIKAHASSLYTKYRLEFSCSAHQENIMLFFFVLPTFLLLCTNIFYFIDSQRRLWKMQNMAEKEGNIAFQSLKKKLRFRLLLNLKLLIVMGIPWTLGICVYVIFLHTWSYLFVFLLMFIMVFISAEGILLFLIMVIFRKRVFRSIVCRFRILENMLPPQWRTFKDWDTDEDHEIIKEEVNA